MELNNMPRNPPTALCPVVYNDFDHSESMNEFFPKMEGRSRLFMSTRGQLVQPWRGQVLEGEIALAIRTTPAVDHHPPSITDAAASNGQRVVTIMPRELPEFLRVHEEHELVVANGSRIFWTLLQRCENADEDSEFLWRRLGAGRFLDVTQLDLLLRLPRPCGELLMPRALYDIAAELAMVHTLPIQPREQLAKLMRWRSTRAKHDKIGFVCGEAHSLFLCATLLRQLRILFQPPLFASAQQHLPEPFFEGLQRLLLRASIARQRIYFNGVACDAGACENHRNQLLVAAGLEMNALTKQRETQELFGEVNEGQSADNVKMNGKTLLKVLAAIRRKNVDLPDLPDLVTADHLHPLFLSLYAIVEPKILSAALFKMDLRLHEDLRVGEDGRVRMRLVNLPHLCELPSAFDYVLQSGNGMLLGTSAHHALLLVSCGLNKAMDPDLSEALVLSAGLVLLHRGYRLIAHSGCALVIEAAGEQLVDIGQRAVEKIVLDHIGQHLNPRECVEVTCRRMCGWEGVADVLLTAESRERLGKPSL